MGAHPDNGIVHALHAWKTRALRAERELADHDGEELLRRVVREGIVLYSLPGVYGISSRLLRDIEEHLAGED